MNSDKSIICCGKKPIRADKYLTSINMAAALLHYLLAVGIVTTFKCFHFIPFYSIASIEFVSPEEPYILLDNAQ